MPPSGRLRRFRTGDVDAADRVVEGVAVADRVVAQLRAVGVDRGDRTVEDRGDLGAVGHSQPDQRQGCAARYSASGADAARSAPRQPGR